MLSSKKTLANSLFFALFFFGTARQRGDPSCLPSSTPLFLFFFSRPSKHPAKKCPCKTYGVMAVRCRWTETNLAQGRLLLLFIAAGPRNKSARAANYSKLACSFLSYGNFVSSLQIVFPMPCSLRSLWKINLTFQSDTEDLCCVFSSRGPKQNSLKTTRKPGVVVG